MAKPKGKATSSSESIAQDKIIFMFLWDTIKRYEAESNRRFVGFAKDSSGMVVAEFAS